MAKSIKTFPNHSALSRLALAIICVNSGIAVAAPVGGTVTSGTGTIGSDQLSLNQKNNVADVTTVQWDSFDIAQDETFIFNQDANDVAINNIGSGSASNILGKISADGTVFLSNSNGFVFGANSYVDTGAFLATTSNISFNGSDTIELTDNSATGTISIHKDASVNANKQESGGYLAFISNDIVLNSDGTPGNSNAEDNPLGLNASNGEVLLSNDIGSTIKLAGLNISFPTSSFTGATTTALDLTNASISANTVILSSDNLTDLLNSVVNQPATIHTTDLIVNSDESGLDVTSAVENAFTFLNNDNIGTATINQSAGTFSFNNTLAISEAGELNIQANSIAFKHNVFANNLDLNLYSNNVAINIGMDEPSDTDDQTFGGTNGLNSLLINVTGNDRVIDIYEDITTSGNLTLEGPVQLHTENNTTPTLYSKSGDISITEALTGINSTGELLLRGNSIALESATNFNKIEFNADSIYLSGDIEATENIKSNSLAKIYLNTNIDIRSESIEFSSSSFTSHSTDLNEMYTLNLIGTGSINSITLDDSQLHDSANGNRLKELNISSSMSGSINNIYMGGNYEVSSFCIHSCISTDTNNNSYNLNTSSNTTLINNDGLSISHATLTGDYIFQSIGNTNSTADISAVTELAGFKLSNYLTINLNGDISTQEEGLVLTANNINLNNDVLISNQNSGRITLGDTIVISGEGTIESSSHDSLISSSNNSSLTISSKNSNLYIGEVRTLSNLTINKALETEGSTELGGDISVKNNISLNNLGDITTSKDINLTTTNTDTSIESAITFSASSIDDQDNDISMSSNNIHLENITANNINLYSTNIELNGDLKATNELNFLNSGATTSILLNEDITLTGEIDFLSSSNTQAKITGDKNLYINSKNSNIYLSTFNTEGGLNSLSITTFDSVNPANLYLISDTDGLITMPDLNGVEGLSLLGHLNLDLGINTTTSFDTSSYDGNLDLSGVNITGSGILDFDTGTGELSLGNIGKDNSDSQIFTSLLIDSTGKLNVNGEISITSTLFNFSNLNAIELNSDLTLGSLEGLAKVDFGAATINGTHDLTLYTNDLTLGTVGNNIALQDLTIVNQSEAPLELANDITLVGSLDIKSNSLILDNTISNTGLNIKIATEGDLIMTKDSTIRADFSDIELTSTTGNIGIGELIAGNSVTIRSELGFLYNNINDYVSNDSTSTNITSTDQYLYGLTNIGKSVASPIVINVLNNGTITAESSGTIYIANLANAKVNATGRVIDGSTGSEAATIDAFTQFKLASLNSTNLPALSSNLGLISNLTWQVDEEESIRKIRSPSSAPSIYYSRNGWRLGQK